MPTFGQMVSVFIGYSIEGAFTAFLIYLLVWKVMGKADGRRLSLERRWHVIGGAVTVIGAGGARITTALLFGGSSMQALWSNSGVGLIGPVVVPLCIAIAYCRYLKATVHPRQTAGGSPVQT